MTAPTTDAPVILARGDWHDQTPTGYVVAGFRTDSGHLTWRLIPAADYVLGATLDQYPDAYGWVQPTGWRDQAQPWVTEYLTDPLGPTPARQTPTTTDPTTDPWA